MRGARDGLIIEGNLREKGAFQDVQNGDSGREDRAAVLWCAAFQGNFT